MMPRDQFSFPYYVEVLLEKAEHKDALTTIIAGWPDRTDSSGTWAIVNFEKWDPAMDAGDKIDRALDALSIPHNIVLNSRFQDFRRWT
jgi:hypothetical protein